MAKKETHKSGWKGIAKLIGLGALTGLMYFTLFHYERDVLSLTAQGKWSFFIPLAVAFVISFAHGAFTSHFWDVLGIKAKK